MELRKIAERLGESAVWERIIYREEVDSTNDLLREIGGEGMGTVAVASRQFSGRGKRGNSWYSPPGGCWLSASLDPLDAEEGGKVTRLAAEAIKRTINFWGLSGRVSPPNDLLVEGKKIAGVLLEPADDFSVLGLGVNVNNGLESLPKNIREDSVSMRGLLGEEVPLEEFIGRLLENLEDLYVDYLNKTGSYQNKLNGRKREHDRNYR